MSGLRVKSSTSKVATVGGLSTQSCDAIRQRVPPHLHVDRPVQQRASIDQVSVQVPTTKRASLVASKGVCVTRPEIILAMRMQPAYAGETGNSLSSVGKMLRAQMIARDVRAENISSFIEQLRADSASNTLLEQLQSLFDEQLTAAGLDVGYMTDVFSTFDAVMSTFDIKAHSRELRDVMTQFDSTGRSALYSLDELFIDHMGFTRDGFTKFTNTKIMRQLALDLMNATRRYTPALFNIIDPDRQTDIDPFTLDRTTSFTGGRFSFDVASLGSVNTARNAFAVNVFNGFIDSLPSERPERMKLIAVTLSRVLSTSSALGTRGVQTELRRLNVSTTEPDPIAELIGLPGASIVDESNVPGALDIVTRFVGDGRNVVLPFERRFIVGETKSYVPGDDYFFDGLTSDPKKFDTSRLVNFVSSMSGIVTSVANVIEASTRVNSTYVNTLYGSSDLTATSIYVAMLNAVGDILTAARGDDVRQRNLMFIIATFKLAQDDRRIRHLLFQLMFVAVLYDELHKTSSQQVELIDAITSNEVKTYGDIPALRGYKSNVVSGDVIAEVDIGAASTKTGTSVVEAAYRHVQQLVVDAVFAALQTNVNGSDVNSLSVKSAQTRMSNGKNMTTVKFERSTVDKLFDSDIRSVMLHIVRVIDRFEDVAGRGAAVGDVRHRTHQVRDGSGNTTYMKLSASIRLMLGFELGAVALGSFDVSRFAGIEQGDIIAVKFNTSQSSTLQSVTSSMRSPIVKPRKAERRENPQSRNKDTITKQVAMQYGTIDATFESELRREFEAVKTALTQDMVVVKSMTLSLRAIGASIEKAVTKARLFFEQTNRRSLMAQDTTSQTTRSRSFTSRRPRRQNAGNVDEAERHARGALLSRQQVGLAYTRLRDVMSMRNAGVKFVDDSQVRLGVKSALWSMLNAGELRGLDGNDSRILSVGIPAGFARMLEDADRVGMSDHGRVARELDVFNVDVYRRDCVNDDIVFAPKRFTFELSRFVGSYSFDDCTGDADSPKRFDDIIKLVKMIDVSSFDEAMRRDQTLSSVIAGERYQFMTPADRTTMVRNHIVSFLTAVYMRMLTGMDCREDSFAVEPNAVIGQTDIATATAFEQLAERLVILSGGRSVEQLRTANPALDVMLSAIEEGELQPGIIQQAMVYDRSGLRKGDAIISDGLTDLAKLGCSRSTLTAGERLRRSITTPRLFERVFNVIVDPYACEVDIERTKSTSVGRLALERAVVSGRIVDVGGSLVPRRPREGESVEVVQFFVVLSPYVEMLTSRVARQSRAVGAVRR